MSSRKSIGAAGTAWAVAALVLALGGCASAPAVIEPEPLVTTITAADGLNPSMEGQPQRLDLMIFQLRTPASFRESQLTAIYPGLERARAAIGPDLVSVQKLQIAPATEQTIEIKLEPDARYLGVAGAFEQFGQARWKDHVEIRDEELTDKLLLRGNRLNIVLDALSVKLGFE